MQFQLKITDEIPASGEGFLPPLRDYQERALYDLRVAVSQGFKRIVLRAPTGAGKCLGPEVPVRMYDGSIKRHDEIVVGDLLLGDDNSPRTVLSVTGGKSRMYRITPTRKGMMPWRCNENHILTLVANCSNGIAKKNQIVDIGIQEYLGCSKTSKHTLKQFAVGFDGWHEVEFPLDPYFIGLWLGDGSTNGQLITNPDEEIISYLREYAVITGTDLTSPKQGDGKCEQWNLVTPRGESNHIREALKEFGLGQKKRLPIKYATSSKKQRARLLAGLFDTDGYYNGSMEICQKNEEIADRIELMSMSLGFKVWRSEKYVKGVKYCRLSISGNFSEIPTRVKRKTQGEYRANRNALRSGFTIDEDGTGEYVGLVVDGNSRYLLSDFTVVHNTVIAAHIIANHLAKGGRPMFCVDAISLVDQTARVFFDFGITDIGVIQGNHEMTNHLARVQIASIQTLARRRPQDGVTLVLIDECHCQFDSMYKLMADWDNLIFVGLTATPYAKGMGKHWETMVTVTSTAELIEAGSLSPFRVFAPSHPDLSGVKTVAGDYHEGQLSEVMSEKSLVGSMLEHWRKYGTPDKTLAFCVDTAHAKHVADMFNSHHVPCGYVDSYTPLEERRKIARKFKLGELKIIANCGVLTKGVDWDVRTLIMARPTRSEMLYQQIVGRALRTAEGKDHATIIDMSSTTSTLGLVTDMELEFNELDDGKKSKSERAKPKEKLPVECPGCTFLKPKGVHACPQCGFAPQKQPTVEHVDGELQEINQGTKTQQRLNKTHTKEAKEWFFGELIAYANEKGYAKGWPSHKYRERYGVWPNKITPRNLAPGNLSEETRSWIISKNIRWAKRNKK